MVQYPTINKIPERKKIYIYKIVKNIKDWGWEGAIGNEKMGWGNIPGKRGEKYVGREMTCDMVPRESS